MRLTFAGSGDAFGSGGRFQACFHLRPSGTAPVLLDCGATSLVALRQQGLDPHALSAVFVSHLHGDHFGGLPFLIIDRQFSPRKDPLVVAGPPGTRDRLAIAREALYPRSTEMFQVEVVELEPGTTTSVAGVEVAAWEVDHRSGAPPLALRLEVDGVSVGYTGDTAWTDALPEVADGTDLFIAEALFYDKVVPYHLRYLDLADRSFNTRRTILTHMSDDMLSREGLELERAHDGLVIDL